MLNKLENLKDKNLFKTNLVEQLIYIYFCLLFI